MGVKESYQVQNVKFLAVGRECLCSISARSCGNRIKDEHGKVYNTVTDVWQDGQLSTHETGREERLAPSVVNPQKRLCNTKN